MFFIIQLERNECPNLSYYRKVETYDSKIFAVRLKTKGKREVGKERELLLIKLELGLRENGPS